MRKTNEMIADHFTKPLDEEKFIKFRELMLYDPNTQKITPSLTATSFIMR